MVLVVILSVCQFTCLQHGLSVPRVPRTPSHLYNVSDRAADMFFEEKKKKIMAFNPPAPTPEV